MSIRIVQLGSLRAKNEGLRLGTVRRPPRGVPKSQFAKQNYYDVWFPNLAPSADTLKLGMSAETAEQWASFVRKYKVEMAKPEAKHDLELLAALSRQTNLSVGCYCEDESHCHRSVLRELLLQNGASLL